MNNKNNIEGRSESIFPKVVSSALWVFSGNALNRTLGFIRTIILARLLSPSDFGLFGIAMLVLGALDRFTQTGIDEALIQKKRIGENYANVAWTINLVRSLVVFALLYFLAPYAAHFFRNEQADPIIKTISLVVILNGLSNIGMIYLQKDLSFKRLFIYKFSGNLADFVIAIPMALILRNIWALLCGMLAGHFIRLVMSYWIHPHRPSLKFDYSTALEILKFGGWITGISIITFLINQSDDAFVARILGTASLGFYYLAFVISNLPAAEISLLVPRVTLPAYAKINEDLQRLRESYLRVLQMTVFFAVPCGLGLLLLAPEFTAIFLGTKWKPIILPLQILSLSGIITSLISTGSSLFYAFGQPRIEFQIQFIRLLVLAAMLYPLTNTWSIVGTSLAVTLSSTAVMPLWLFRSMRTIEANLMDLFQKFLPTLTACSTMLFGIFLLNQMFSDINIIRFIYLVLFGTFLYLSTHFFIWKRFRVGPLQEVKALLELKSA
jgi:PST family polysaccharide transporter